MVILRFHAFFHSEVIRRVVHQAAVCGVVLATAACDGSARHAMPAAPSPPENNVSGTWTGMFAGLSTVNGDGQLSVTFDHRRIDAARSALFGTWRLLAADGSTIRSGSVSGTVQGTEAVIELSPSTRRDCNPPVLPFAILADGFSLAVTTASNPIRGVVTAYGCTTAVEAPLELVR